MKRVLKNETETKEFAQDFLKDINKDRNSATVIALEGSLGSGKTTFVKYLAQELGVENHITSPTFLLIKKYNLLENSSNFKDLFHIDAYRLDSFKEIEYLGVDEIIKDPNNLVFIEWADKIKEIIPDNSVWIKLSYGENDTERLVEVIYN